MASAKKGVLQTGTEQDEGLRRQRPDASQAPWLPGTRRKEQEQAKNNTLEPPLTSAYHHGWNRLAATGLPCIARTRI